MRSRAFAAATATLAAVALLALSCSSPAPAPGPTGNSAAGTSAGGSPSAAASATVPAGLEKFYSQKISWRDCLEGDSCGQLTVPLDYAQPDGATIKLALLKVPAKGKRVGSLVVNPGGPGGSGVQYAMYADYIVGKPVRAAYDIVGFDPRGVGESEPIVCLNDREQDAFLAGDPTPDDATEEQQFAASAKGFADACKTKAGPLLAHVSTKEAARDMDVLRAALGEDKLTYLGKSYGTYLGATYAGLFPRNVGRFVLDGVVAPDLTSEELNLGQAEGFELATRAWAKYCVEQGNCPLGSDVEAVMSGLRAFLTKVDGQPLTTTGDQSIPAVTEGWASTGIAAAMYDEAKWGTLVDAMRKALAGDGSGLMSLAYSYAEREPGGRYAGNLMQVIYAVNCLDKPESSDIAEHKRLAAEAEAKAPTWGTFLMWSSLPCGFWPVKTAKAPERITAEGSGPIVVVGTTRDPATPYEWSVRLHDQLSDASLVTYDGDGHTAYTRSNACVDNAIDAYYVEGVVPKDGLRC